MSISRHREAKRWLEGLPKNWRSVPLRQLAEITYGFPADSAYFTNDPGTIPLIRIRDITSGKSETNYKGTYPKESVIDDGDVLIGMDGDFNLRIWSGGRALLNQRCCRVAGKDPITTKYLSYALPCALSAIHDLTLSTTVKHLLADGLEGALLPIPTSRFELMQIVNLLENETAKIDQAMSLLRRELETLEQLKMSMIHEAVTKGLDDTAPMKPSGVEWIGDIPEHWETNRLRNLFDLVSGATPSKDDTGYWQGTIPWVSSQEVKDDVISETTYRISEAAVASCSTKVLPKGTPIVVVRSGILQHTLPISLLGDAMAINQDVKGLLAKSSLSPEYLFYLFRGNNANLLKVLIKDKSTVDNISTESLKNLSVVIPPLGEQSAIIRYLRAKCSSLDRAAKLKQDQMEILANQRESLIFEYVTGKRRVNEVA